MRLQFACWFRTPVQIIWQLTMLSHYLTQSEQWLIYPLKFPLQLFFRVMSFWLNVNLMETPQDISPCGRIGRPSLFAFSRWGIILRSTVRTYDISWFSLLLLLQNGSQTDPRFRFAQKTASEKVFSSILAANKCCQSTAGYVSFETK